MCGYEISSHTVGIGCGNVATARFLQSPQGLPKDEHDTGLYCDCVQQEQ